MVKFNSIFLFTYIYDFFSSNLKGNNSILVILGANLLLEPVDIDKSIDLIKKSSILVTNLEIPIETALYSLEQAKINNGNKFFGK